MAIVRVSPTGEPWESPPSSPLEPSVAADDGAEEEETPGDEDCQVPLLGSLATG
jgi:hypothetical protein